MADRGRVQKLVGMLGSQFDGERANAAGMLQRMAEAEKTTIVDLLSRTLGSGSERIIYRDRIVERVVEKVVYKDRIIYRDGAAQTVKPQDYWTEPMVDPWAERKPNATFGKASSGHDNVFAQRMATAVNEFSELLTEWEIEFIANILPRLQKGNEPSSKQREVMARIWKKVTG